MRQRFPVVLASASPRREALLRTLIPAFEVQPANIDEEAVQNTDPWQAAEVLATAKARVIFERRPECIVIGGDTIVALENPNGFIHLGKPRDPEDARTMLKSLSDREHLVVTGICICSPNGEAVASETTRVRFRLLDAHEISDYVSTCEPMDKAGSYAIQGGASGFVESIDGDYDNVVGLPLQTVNGLLRGISGLIEE